MVELLIDLVIFAPLRLLMLMIALPISWMMATPVILVAALFQSDAYGRNVRAGYQAVYDFWDQLLPHGE